MFCQWNRGPDLYLDGVGEGEGVHVQCFKCPGTPLDATQIWRLKMLEIINVIVFIMQTVSVSEKSLNI